MILLYEDAAAALLHNNNYIIKHKQKMTKRQLLLCEISNVVAGSSIKVQYKKAYLRKRIFDFLNVKC